MKLTMSSEMGIHSVWFLATLDSENPVLSSDIARSIRVSETYLIKVLKKLVSARLLVSRKGKNGGYRLRKKSTAITLSDVVRACEGDDDIYTCLDEERGCLNDRACPVCLTLRRAETAMFNELSKTSIADLVRFGWKPSAIELSRGRV